MTVWMLWRIEEKTRDPFGLAHYQAKHGAAPNQAQVPVGFADEDLANLAQALGAPVEKIIRTQHCAPGHLFLTHQPE